MGSPEDHQGFGALHPQFWRDRTTTVWKTHFLIRNLIAPLKLDRFVYDAAVKMHVTLSGAPPGPFDKRGLNIIHRMYNEDICESWESNRPAGSGRDATRRLHSACWERRQLHGSKYLSDQ